MTLEVTQKDATGTAQKKMIDISFPRFLKSLAVAGTGLENERLLDWFSQGFGFFSLYYHYWHFDWRHIWPRFVLRKPPAHRYDPSEISNFTRVIGKTIGDILARSLSGALWLLLLYELY